MAATLAAGIAAGCAGGMPYTEPAPAARSGLVAGVQAGGAYLDAQAFVAEAAFLFPEQSRALVHGLLRSELARREAQRLGLAPDAGEVEKAVAQALGALEQSLGPGEKLEDWARSYYGRSAQEVRQAYAARLAENQLYQLALRADAWLSGRLRVAMLVGREEDLAQDWARKLRAGADHKVLARESLEPGPAGNGEFPPLPAYLPEPLGAALHGAEPGAVVGPLRLAGDQSWRVMRVLEVLPPLSNPPPRAVLLDDLRAHPVTPLEARAWYEEMLRRYTARALLPNIQPAQEPFVDFPRS